MMTKAYQEAIIFLFNDYVFQPSLPVWLCEKKEQYTFESQPENTLLHFSLESRLDSVDQGLKVIQTEYYYN